jgi:hypothetical protein
MAAMPSGSTPAARCFKWLISLEGSSVRKGVAPNVTRLPPR